MKCQSFKTFQEAFQKPFTIIKWDYNVELCFYHFPTNSEWTWEADSPEILVFSQPNFTFWWNHRVIHSQPHSRHCTSAKCKYYDLIPDYCDHANSMTRKFLVASTMLSIPSTSFSYQYFCIEEKYPGYSTKIIILENQLKEQREGKEQHLNKQAVVLKQIL